MVAAAPLAATTAPAAPTDTNTVTLERGPGQVSAVASAPIGGEVVRERWVTRSLKRINRFTDRLDRALAPGDKAGPGAGLAVAGLVCGIVGIIAFGIPLGILATVFGAVALGKYKQGLHGRKGMSIAAIVLGIAAFIGAVIVLVLTRED